MDNRFLPAVEPPEGGEGQPGRWFAFRGTELLVREACPTTDALPDPAGPGAAEIPRVRDPGELDPAWSTAGRHYLGTLDGQGCWSVELPDAAEPPPGHRFRGLRALHGRLPDDQYAVAGRAVQVVAWARDHAFCGRCGVPTAPVPGERARRCPRCGLTVYPRLSPAVIVLVERADGAALLARAHSFPTAFYSTLAGFVEPGESLEEAVAREVAEEVGVALTGIRYFGSQPWPFPNSLMIGFTARYAGGELTPQASEIADAGWFFPHALPTVPPPPSIARRLIDAWVARHLPA